VTDIVVNLVTFSSQELGLRLAQRWPFFVVEGRKVLIYQEHVADLDKRGSTVSLKVRGPRELVRWVAWAIQEICPDAEAIDEEGEPAKLAAEPMAVDEVEKMARGIEAARRTAIAKEADPAGGAHEAVALVLYLVKKEKLELAGPPAAVARAIFPLLRDVDATIGDKLEDALLDLDEVDELYADASELATIVQQNRHIFED